MVVSEGFVHHKEHYAGKECKSQAYEDGDLEKRDNVTVHMLKWHMSNLIIKWLIGTDILTDCSLHSTVQYLTKHGNWLNAGSNILDSHIIPIPPRACNIPVFNPLRMYRFCCTFGVLGAFVLQCSQLWPRRQNPHLRCVRCVDKVPCDQRRSHFSGSRGSWAGRSSEVFVAHSPLCLLGDSTRISCALQDKGDPSLFLQAVKGQ